MTFLEHSKGVIKKNGGRITKTRIDVIEILQNSKIPLMPYVIADKINIRGGKIDVVTVYRILEALMEMKLVHKVSNGYTHCQHFECQNDQHCHHQFTCQKCEIIEEVHISDQDFLKSIHEKFKDLLINSHTFQFSGLCKKCQK